MQRQYSVPVGAAIALVFLLAAPFAGAHENRYDAFAKTLAPFVRLLAPASDRAMRAEIEVLSVTGLDPRVQGVRLTVALKMPDKLLLTGQSRDDVVMCGRAGQDIWVSPGPAAREWIDILAPGALEKSTKASEKIPDFGLPFPQKQLVFLPALFVVEDAGDETIAGEACQVLDLKLMPELANSLKTGEWSARLWVSADHKPVRLELTRGSTSALIGFKNVNFEPSLPDSAWTAPADGNGLQIDAGQARRIVDAVLARFK